MLREIWFDTLRVSSSLMRYAFNEGVFRRLMTCYKVRLNLMGYWSNLVNQWEQEYDSTLYEILEDVCSVLKLKTYSEGSWLTAHTDSELYTGYRHFRRHKYHISGNYTYEILNLSLWLALIFKPKQQRLTIHHCQLEATVRHLTMAYTPWWLFIPHTRENSSRINSTRSTNFLLSCKVRMTTMSLRTLHKWSCSSNLVYIHNQITKCSIQNYQVLLSFTIHWLHFLTILQKGFLDLE